MQRITFSEQAFGTQNPVYYCKTNTVSFTGQIVEDGAQPDSPAFAANATYIGPVTITFSQPVTEVQLQAGYFNNMGSTTVRYYDKNGTLLSSQVNSQYGIQLFEYETAVGVGRIEVINTSADQSGFSIDSVTFVNEPPSVAPVTARAPFGVSSSLDDINGLLWGYKWDHTNLTYSFPVSATEYLRNGYAEINGFQPLSPLQQSVYTDTIIKAFDSVCGLSFQLTTGEHADIRFGQALSIDYSDGQGLHLPGNGDGTAEAIPHDPIFATTAWGDAWFSTNAGGNDNSTPVFGNFIYTAAFMHELGHALGLKHGHITQEGGGNLFPELPSDHDSQEYSIMTYNTYPNIQDITNQYPQSLMQDDIATLQYMYGAQFDPVPINTTYRWNPSTGQQSINGVAQGMPHENYIFMTVWDGGGTDTYDFSNYNVGLQVDLRPGAWTMLDPDQLAYLGENGWGTNQYARGNIANALLYNRDLRSLIENVNGGSEGDTLTGNQIDNMIDGRGGADSMTGSLGNDTYIVDNIGDRITDRVDEGTADKVKSWVSYSLTPGAQIEFISTISYGATTAINLTGNEFAQSITGNAGANTLDGKAGADTLIGLGGDDRYYVDDIRDIVTEAASGGTDRVFTSVTYSLTNGSAVEFLSTTLGIGLTALNLTGNSYAQTITGNFGANILDGKGGDDTLVGLFGDDRYIVDSLGDKTIETSLGGFDRVVSSVTYALGAGQSIEYLSTTANGGTAAINLYGNELAQTVVGNAGANWINGAYGNDVLTGGSGSDTFIFSTSLSSLANIDIITDFSVTDDTIRLARTVFTSLGAGALTSSAFWNGSVAHDSDDRIIYNSSTGALYYDANGSGTGGQIQFARLTPGLGLSAADFMVV